MSAADRVDRLLASRARADAPGAALAVLSGGEFVHARTLGLASVEHQIAITPDTAFRIGSVTKHFAVAAALMMVREERLDIDAPVCDVLPEAPDYPQRPTVRHLMNNTSGVPDFLELLIASGAGVQRPVTWEQSRDLVLRQTTLNCEPGAEFIYSAGGFVLLSMILERVEARPMEEILEARLFAPLGMKRTALVRANSAVVPGMATPYIQRAPVQFVLGGWGLEASGEGGIVSTLDDMVTWAAELSHPRVLGPEIVAAMSSPLVYANGVHGNYGLGLYARTEHGHRVFGHGGRMPGFRAEIACYPDDDLALVILTNLHNLDPYALGREVAAAWLDLPPAGKAAPTPLPAGRYRAAETGDLIEIRHADGQPLLAASSGPIPLVPSEEGWWEPVSAVWDLRLRSAAGGLDSIYCGRELRYTPIAPPAKPRADDFAGDYRSDSLGSTYHVRADALGGLAVRMQGELGYYDTVLEPMAPDLFRAAPADPRAAWNQPLLRFVRDARGVVEKLLYSTDRTRDLSFVRMGR
jgi:D-aminopeptidase